MSPPLIALMKNRAAGIICDRLPVFGAALASMAALCGAACCRVWCSALSVSHGCALKRIGASIGRAGVPDGMFGRVMLSGAPDV